LTFRFAVALSELTLPQFTHSVPLSLLVGHQKWCCHNNYQ